MEQFDSPGLAYPARRWILTSQLYLSAYYNLPPFNIVLGFPLVHLEFWTHSWTCTNEAYCIRKISWFVGVINETLCDGRLPFSFAVDL
jgi:hypothetical protein